MPLPINSVAQAFTEQQQRQADIGATQAGTMQRLMQVAIGNYELQTAQKNQALNDAYLEQLRQRSMYASAVTNDPNAPSLGQQQSGMKMINTDGTVTAAPGTLNAQEIADLRQQKFKTEQDLQFMQAWGRPHQEWTPLFTRLNSINNDLRIASTEQEKLNAENNKQMASMLRDAASPQDIANAVNTAGQVYGPAAAFNLDKKLLHDANGNYLWNDAQRAKIAPLVNQFTSNQLRDESNHRKALEANQALERVQEQERIDIQRANSNSETAARQNAIKLGWANYGLRKEHMAQVLEASGLKQAQQTTKTDQAEIYKVAKDYRIQDYKQAYDVAARTADALQDPSKGYEAVTTANARALVDQAKRMFNNFVGYGGNSKVIEQNYRQMNSMLNNPEKWIDTIGTGNKILAKDRMLELSNEMARFYQQRNADLVKRELSIAQNTNAKGGNAAWLNFAGDINQAVNSGQAKIGVVGDKRYIVFGPKPEDKFELPSANPNAVRMPSINLGGE